MTTEPISDATSPIEAAIRVQAYERYRSAVAQLRPRDREMVVARVEMQWGVEQIAQRFSMPSLDAARVAVSRALKRLAAILKVQQ